MDSVENSNPTIRELWSAYVVDAKITAEETLLYLASMKEDEDEASRAV